ncbi:MAG: PAS domain-containing sensor histidine kinase [Taibaiella sp.]|nr:PAS domain-containing sensor histidine kinase [Taibaiella sp.]
MYLLEKIAPEKKVAGIYLSFSLVYIFLSDKFVDFIFFHSGMLTTAQTYKGFAFVTATSGLIYFLSKGKSAAIKSLEEKSAGREAFYKALIMQSGDMTMLTNTEGKIIFTGENIGNLLGYTPEEFTGCSAFDLVHPDEKENLKEFNNHVINNPGVPFNYEARVRHRNGSYVWMEGLIVNRLNDSKINGILTTARNTDKRKEAEAHLNQSERMFRAAFEQLSVGMANINLAGEFTLTNNYLCDLTGYSHEELADLKCWMLAEPSNRKQAELDFERLLAGDKTACCTQHTIARKNGSALHVEQMLSLIADDNGNPLYVALVIKDIEAVTRAKNELAYKNRELDTFIYRSSHDLRGPITTLIGLTELGMTEIPESESKEYFANCNTVSKRMRKTLDDLMSVSYIKDLTATTREVDPQSILENALANETLHLKTSEAAFYPEIETTAKCNTDANLLSLIIRHLLANAFTFRRKGVQHKVYLNVNVAADKTSIYVMDNGTGIAPAEREEIYDLYYNGKSPLRGSGVGLYLVKMAVEKLGGTIAMESEPGYGTRFMVTLPNEATVVDN